MTPQTTTTPPPARPRSPRSRRGERSGQRLVRLTAGLGSLGVLAALTAAAPTDAGPGRTGPGVPGSGVRLAAVTQPLAAPGPAGPGGFGAAAPAATPTPPFIGPTVPPAGTPVPSGGLPTFNLPPPPASTPAPAGPPGTPGPGGPPGSPGVVPSGPVVIDPADPGTPDPGPGGDPGADQGGPEKKPGRFDIPGQIRYAINNWIRGLTTSALNPVLDLLGRTVLTTPDVTRSGRVAGIWSMNAGIANTVYVLFVLAGAAIVMAHMSLQTSYTIKEVAPRLVVAFIAANASLSVAHEAIGFTNALSAALLGGGLSPAATEDALRRMLLEPVVSGGIFLVLMGLFSAVLALLLLLTYIGRVAVTVVLVAVAPLALCTHALAQTDGLARLWWRAFFGCLGIQLGQSLTLIVALRVFFNNGNDTLGLSPGGLLVNMLVACCLLVIMIRIPVWVSRLVFAPVFALRLTSVLASRRYRAGGP